MPNVHGEEEHRDALVADTFSVLDQRRRGFVSRLELAHLLDAMQADATVKLAVPEALVLANNTKDARVSLGDLQRYLGGLSIADLEDVKWFAESVVRVETELCQIWRAAVTRWRERVERLYKRDLHRYLLTSQPERVARWLLLRTSMDEVGKDSGSIGLLGLGISAQEVEVLFADETADDINRCSDKIEPFLSAFELRGQLTKACLDGDLTQRCSDEQGVVVAELLAKLTDLAQQGRELACLLIHEDTLSFATTLVRSSGFPQAVVAGASALIMALVGYRMQENARDYEKLCQHIVAGYLELGLDLRSFNLHEEVIQLHTAVKPGRAQLLQDAGAHKETLSDWVGSLLTLPADLSRGEMLDTLIKFDERRLLLVDDGGERAEESSPVAVSLLAYGRAIPYILCRLDISSHYTLHEHRTPMRTHLWKLLLNVLSSAGDLGRRLFRAAEGARVTCCLARGDAWGVERREASPEEEEDRAEEEEVLTGGTSPSQTAREPDTGAWPLVEQMQGSVAEHRFYSMDFVDDKFYGSKDRTLAAAFFEYMASDTLWGEEAVVEEMMQYPNVMQTFSRVRPPGYALLRMLLRSAAFPQYLEASARSIAEVSVQRSLERACLQDGTRHAVVPLGFDLVEGRCSAAESLRQELVATEGKNLKLRILAHTFHHLQATLEGESSTEPTAHEEISDLCKLLASRLPLTLEEVGDISVTIYMQIADFTRKVLLMDNQLPPVAATPQSPLMSMQSPSHSADAAGSAPLRTTSSLEQPALSRCRTEFLVELRLLELIRLQWPDVPLFTVELQDLLELLLRRSPSSGLRGDREVAGEEYPWRSGLVALKTFNIAKVPLRRLQLRNYPRHRPLDIVLGLDSVLREYAALTLWDAHTDHAQDYTENNRKRNGLLALVFAHLCYYHSKEVSLEDSAQGLSLRLGTSLELLQMIRERLEHPAISGLYSGPDFASAPAAPGCHVLQGTQTGKIVVLEVSVNSNKVAFICMQQTWMLWANSIADPTQALTDCSGVKDHFKFGNMEPVKKEPRRSHAGFSTWT